MDMTISIYVTHACHLVTHDAMIGNLFTMMIANVLSPEAWTAWIAYLSPGDLDVAKALAVSCMGLPI